MPKSWKRYAQKVIRFVKLYVKFEADLGLNHSHTRNGFSSFEAFMRGLISYECSLTFSNLNSIMVESDRDSRNYTFFDDMQTWRAALIKAARDKQSMTPLVKEAVLGSTHQLSSKI